jgi:hypothetical protein
MAELRNLVESDGLQRMPVEGGEDEIIDREHASRPITIGQKVDSCAFPFPSSALDAMFSGEEGMGRFLDLYESHARYVNLRGAKRCVRPSCQRIKASIQLTRAVGTFDAVTG